MAPIREGVCLVSGFDMPRALVVPPNQKLPSSENHRVGFPLEPRLFILCIRRYTGLTSTGRHFYSIRFTHLRLLRKNPFLTTGAKSRFSLAAYNFLEADFWPGTLPGCPLLGSSLASAWI